MPSCTVRAISDRSVSATRPVQWRDSAPRRSAPGPAAAPAYGTDRTARWPRPAPSTVGWQGSSPARSRRPPARRPRQARAPRRQRHGRQDPRSFPGQTPARRPGRAAAGRSSASDTNAVLHDLMKSVLNGTSPSASPPALLKRLPLTVTSAGQATVASGSRPRPSSAAVVTTLNVDPGGYRPSSARSTPSVPPGPFAAARICPDVASTATIAAGVGTWPSAVSAAVWTPRSSDVVSGVPDVPEISSRTSSS